MSIVLIKPQADNADSERRLNSVLDAALCGTQYITITRADQLKDICGKRLIFAIDISDDGINSEYIKMLSKIRRDKELLSGCIAGVIIDGNSALYTKSVATELTFAANLSGCAFIGRPLVEATDTLKNFKIQAKNAGCDLISAYKLAVKELVSRVGSESFPSKDKPNLLVLHASNHKTSNTMSLWNEIKYRLGNSFEFNEIGLRNGTLADCSGCPYTMCLHFGEKGRCFYGGVMQDEVYPAVRSCDGIVMICPNYNDAISANLTAFVNRLTALFRQTRFYDKAIFAVVVSGYSGGDIVARQLISALNMNKSFYLPANFAVIETANDPGEALLLNGIEDRLDTFSENILKTYGLL